MSDSIVPRYWLDSDALIQSQNGPYGYDFVPGFWSLLEQACKRGLIASSTKVREEIRRKDDHLKNWIDTMGCASFFFPPDRLVQENLREISDYVVGRYDSAAAAGFLGVADPWLIAHAKRSNSAVVTWEKAVADNAKAVKIPNVCRYFRIRCINVPALIRELKGVLILG